MSTRSRSASPERHETGSNTQKPKPKGGFKWKEKKPKDFEEHSRRDSGHLERGYRNRSPRRELYRDRDNHKSRDDFRNERGNRDAHPTRRQDHSPRPDRQDRDERRADKTNPSSRPDKDKDEERSSHKKKKEKKPKLATPTGPMIVVNVNDRLGTKAAIPCLPSDSVKAFKAIVAAHIGRQPHEIMLKRQGERPFKDQLTLEDYGVSNGVQLDLEIDTGD